VEVELARRVDATERGSGGYGRRQSLDSGPDAFRDMATIVAGTSKIGGADFGVNPAQLERARGASKNRH
jgi:hypothetical protein